MYPSVSDSSPRLDDRYRRREEFQTSTGDSHNYVRSKADIEKAKRAKRAEKLKQQMKRRGEMKE